MVKILINFVVFCLVQFIAIAQLPAVITCWQQNKTQTGFANALTNVQEVNYSDTFVYVKTNDIPSWIQIGYDWPNNPWFAVPMNYQFKIRRKPIPNVGPETKTGYGHIGLWKNGCSIYNPKDAKSYKDSSVWFQNAWFWEHLIGETFDPCIGHPNGSGEYHTHVSPACLYDITDSTQASPLIGYAFDGYPIYGGYGHINPLDTNSAIKRLKSSYRLRNITERTVLPNGTKLNSSQYGPKVGKYIPSANPKDNTPIAADLGAYMEDYEFVEGLGDLDIHNGRFCKTREYPNGTYAYFTTLDWVTDVYGSGIKPVFPFVIGTAYYGEVYPTDGNTGPNSGFVVIDEPVTPYVTTNISNGELTEKVKINLFPNPAYGYINIQIKASDLSKVYKATIYDQLGKLINQANLIANNLYVYDTSQLDAGSYTLEITSNSDSFAHKFVVLK